ncbi:MAG: tetratricopeptide repeat protein [Candidatus Binatia bacterium]
MATRPISRAARWRIATLVLVHLLIAAHIVHWKLAGTSLSSIQLSNAGRFVAEGVATAALFLFAFLLLATLVFGRFFCAWGCHMLALQEVCRFLLGKIGVRPKLRRSRLLMIVPVYAAFYIYLQPLFERAWLGRAFPSPTLQLTSRHLWAALPGPIEGVALVLIGGLLMVYTLGALSFCKYVCPYGALFALADTAALGRIRLIGECDGCARCTAACTTGVRVHEHVQRLSMVADSGCMRCLECVSACPRRVLAYRFGRPALTAGSRAGLSRYAFAWREEAGMFTVFAVSLFAFHGLYNAIPLLVSLAASVVIAYVSILTVRLVQQQRVALRGITLKRAGRLSKGGVVFVACAAAVFLVVGHSLFIQYHQRRAAAVLHALGFPRQQSAYSVAQRRLLHTAAAHLSACSRYGLADIADWNMGLAWTYRALGNPQLVERYLRRAIALDPTQPVAHFNLGKQLARQGRRGEAARAFAQAVRLAPSLASFVPADYAAVQESRAQKLPQHANAFPKP